MDRVGLEYSNERIYILMMLLMKNILGKLLMHMKKMVLE